MLNEMSSTAIRFFRLAQNFARRKIPVIALNSLLYYGTILILDDEKYCSHVVISACFISDIFALG